jgi:hypothetical protein
MGGRCPLAGFPVCCGLADGPGVAYGGGGRGLGGLDQVSGNAVVGSGVPQTRLAGGTGLVGAVGAGCGAVAFVVGGDVRSGQEGLDFLR